MNDEQSLRVALLLETGGGGSGRHVLDLTRGLLARGHAPVVILSAARAEPLFVAEAAAIPGAKIAQVDMRRGLSPRDFSAWISLRRQVSELGPFDVIHGHSSKAGALARLIPDGGAARVYTPHALYSMNSRNGPIVRLFYGFAESALGKFRSDAVIAVGQDEYNHAIRIGIPAHRLHLITNGISFRPQLTRREARSALGLPSDGVVVGFVGRFTAQKDPATFVRAIAVARARGAHVLAVMIGDGEEMACVRRSRRELGMDNVILLGGNIDAWKHFSAIDIFCLTSRYEAMPYVLLEALASGCAIVARGVGGTRETVLDGFNGARLAPQADAGHIGDIIFGLASDEAKRRLLAERSRQHSARFSAERMVDETLSVYRQSR